MKKQNATHPAARLLFVFLLGLVAIAAPSGCDTGPPDMPDVNIEVKDDGTRPRRQQDDPFVFDSRLYTKTPKKATQEEELPEPPQQLK